MRAITVVPGKQGSARLDDLPEPDPAAGAVLVQALALGVCGTDLEITGGRYGWAPPGRERLVLGHESLGRVIEAPGGGELARGDLVAGIVRHPDPVPCKNCAIGEWDMCRNGRYTELGAVYHHGSVEEACRESDVVIECTGVGDLVFDVMQHLAPNGIVCLTGLSSGGRSIGVDAGALNRELVLSNEVIVGSVNANRRHYQYAAEALAKSDHDWLARLITRQVPPDHFQEALVRQPDDVKVVVQFAE